MNARSQIQNVQLLHFFLFSKIHVDEVLRVLRIVHILVKLHLFNEVISYISDAICSLAHFCPLSHTFWQNIVQGEREVCTETYPENIDDAFNQPLVLFIGFGKSLVGHHLPEDVDDRNVELRTKENVVVTCEKILNHLVHLKMDRALNALSTEAKIFECLEGEPSLGRPLGTLGEDNASRNVVPEPDFPNQLVRISSTKLLLLEELFCQVEVIDDVDLEPS